MDAPITDPTLSAYHSLPGDEYRDNPRQRIYFASLYTPSGELRTRKIVADADDHPAELKLDLSMDSEQGDG